MKTTLPHSVLINATQFGNVTVYETVDYLSVEASNVPNEEIIYEFIKSKDASIAHLLRDAPYVEINDKVYASPEKGWKKVIFKKSA